VPVLERLLYRSQATHKLGSLHLFTLLARARERNLRLGITGHLLYLDEKFVQCIEGPPSSIETLWQRLQLDDRHFNLELLARGPLEARRFPDWSMAFSSYSSFRRFSLPGFFPIDEQGMNEFTERCVSA
jgi:hypothetical protein